MCAFSTFQGGAIPGIMASIVNYKGSTQGSLSALFILEIYEITANQFQEGFD